MGNAAGAEAIVLAAGASSRLGRPKALLEFDGKTALERILDVLRETGVRRGVVVVGSDAEQVEAAVDPAPLEYALNSFPEAGRTGSILVGLAVTSPEADVLLWPVDRPLAGAATVRALLAGRAGCGERTGVILPEAEGGRGHPFVLRSVFLPALRGANPDANLREVIRDSGMARRVIPVDDPGIHVNVDTPEDYETALAWWREMRGPPRRRD